MKKSSQIISVFICLSIILSVGIQAQESFQKIKLDRHYSFDSKSKSKVKEVKVEITKGYNYLKIEAKSHIVAGQLKIEIFNPKGEKKGMFDLGDFSKEDEDLTEVSGEISKTFLGPMTGVWKIKIMPKGCAGILNLSTMKDLLTPQMIMDELHK